MEALKMSISTELKATPKLSVWIKAQMESAAKYIPGKGGICNLCGRFCRTNHTDSKTGTRSHYCHQCGVTFQTVLKIAAKPADQVGKIPTSIDEPEQKPVEIDKTSEVKTPTKTKAKTGKKR